MSVLPTAALDTASDEQLVCSAQAGEEEAFLLLVARCMPMFKSLSHKYSSLHAESEDLVQEGLLALLSAVRTYKDGKGASFRTYAYACARNRMISVCRCLIGSNKQELSPPDQYDLLASDDATDPALLLLRREEGEMMRKRLRSLLTPVEFEVLMLYLGSYSYREIADQLHIGTKAVDNALQRLRRKLALSSAYTA